MTVIRASQPQLGTAAQDDDFGPAAATGAAAFEVQFRKEVAQIVQEILHRNYVANPEACAKVALQRGVTAEQLISAVIAHRVMKKVDEEYV